QFTESFSVNQLANLVAEAHPGHVEINHLDDPRVEKEDHYYRAAHTKLLDLGLEPHLLSEETIRNLLGEVERHLDRVDTEVIRATVDWRRTANTLPGATLAE
ncbi:MAG: NAD-dependent dehydratase, partial [Acidimicrobiales bacterium]